MHTELIAQAAHSTHTGTRSFPEIVHSLMEAGVESYHVDYVRRQNCFYGKGEAVVTVSIPYEGLPPVSETFQPEALRSAILDSQRHGQSHRDFSQRAMAAGVLGYLACLRGKRVVYFGRQGDVHTEWFPGAAPQ